MFVFVRFLLLAVIVLAVVLFIQPNLLKELGLQLPEEETGVTTAPEVIEEREEAAGTEAPADEALTESLPASDAPLSEDAPASAEAAAGTAPATLPETPADMPEPAPPVGEEAAAPAVAPPADEPLPPFKPVGEGDTRLEVPAEGVTGPGEEMENAQQPAEFPGEGLIETPAPASLNEDAPPASQRQPLFPEEAELPLEPASVEEPPSPAETMEENGSGTNETLESPQQEPVDVQPPADETAPAESAAEADEIPTAGSPELQRVLENIDRTFNN